MKKILIPLFGVLILVFLTPIILAKLANSNIDKYIATLQNKGIYIQNISKDISYLETYRKFRVNYYGVDMFVNLKFKNLPITTAKFDITLKNFIPNLKIHLITKDLKTINFKIDDYKDFITIKDLKGIYKKPKLLCNAKEISMNNFVAQNIKLNANIKNLSLFLVDFNVSIEKLNNYTNIKNNFKIHLYPNNTYFIDDDLIINNCKIKITKHFKINEIPHHFKIEKNCSQNFKLLELLK